MRKIVALFLIILFVFPSTPMTVESAFTNVKTMDFPELYPYEEVTGILTAEKMEITIFPLRKDFFYSYFSGPLKKTPSEVVSYVVSDVELGYKNLYLAPDPINPDGFVRYTVFYHMTGSQFIAVGLYDRGEKDGEGNYVPKEEYFSNDIRTNELSPDTEHSVLGTYYPNKIINSLEVAEAILDYQTINGPFVAGKEYSLWKIMDFDGRDYLLGKTSSGSLVTGGGACVMATNWMKLQYLCGAEITQQWQHPTNQKYFETPLGADVLTVDETDATVSWPDYDLTWIQKETGWVSITATVMPDGDFLKNPFGDKNVSYDAIEIITIRFTKTKPDLSVDSIHNLQQAYIEYRLDENRSNLSLSENENQVVKRVVWVPGDENSQFLAKIFPEERVSRFESELAEDPFLKSLVLLRNTVNQVSPKSDTLMGTYLRESEWYKQEVLRLKNDKEAIAKIEQGLRSLDISSNSYTGQKIRGYGLGVLISEMDGRFVQIKEKQVAEASDLVYEEIRSGQYQSYRGVEVISSLEEVNIGDFGVRYDTPSGHLFAVVGKKIIENKTVLLIISANQREDGKITIFEVDEMNFEAVFGIPAFKKVVVRGK